ncbi:MAG: hypothetical protein AVDCRST_MAG86-1991, partial [uncultured Truepera sp.]
PRHVATDRPASCGRLHGDLHGSARVRRLIQAPVRPRPRALRPVRDL